MIKLKYFTAGWCGPCKITKPIIKEIKDDINIDVQFIDIDEDNTEALNYNIRSIPTVVIESGGLEVDRMIGAHTKNAYMDRIKSYM